MFLNLYFNFMSILPRMCKNAEVYYVKTVVVAIGLHHDMAGTKA